MKHNKLYNKTLTRLTVGLLYFLTVVGMLMIVLYVWPRDIATVSRFETTQQNYVTGDTLSVVVDSQRFIDAQVSSNIFLVCGQNTYFIKTIAMPSLKDDGAMNVTFPLFIIPADVFPPECKVLAVNKYEVNFFLGFHRDYIEQFYTNQFIVTSK